MKEKEILIAISILVMILCSLSFFMFLVFNMWIGMIVSIILFGATGMWHDYLKQRR